ncbi:MAG: methyltransferase domain-containing protein [Pseudomonadota bacterium]
MDQKYYFVEEYEQHVAQLMKAHDLDEAMSLAVGGHYEVMGKNLLNVAVHAGLKNGMSVLDFGCGSGRLSTQIAKSAKLKSYLGIDLVQELLDYADNKTPATFTFEKSLGLTIPAKDNTFDIVFCFSVFTHLVQVHSFIYMEEFFRTLKPGGRLVFSFLEMTDLRHKRAFEQAVQNVKSDQKKPITAFLERPEIAAWASLLDARIVEYIDSGPLHIGQTVAILEKQKA